MIKAAEKELMKIGPLLVRPALNTQNLFKGKNIRKFRKTSFFQGFLPYEPKKLKPPKGKNHEILFLADFDRLVRKLHENGS